MKKYYFQLPLYICCILFIISFSFSLRAVDKSSSNETIIGEWKGKDFIIKNNILEIRGGNVSGSLGEKNWTNCKINFEIKNLNKNPKAYFVVRPRYAWGRKFYEVCFLNNEIRIGYMLRETYKPMIKRIKYKLPVNKYSSVEINMSGYTISVKVDNKVIAEYTDSQKLIATGDVLFNFNKYSADVNKISVTSKAYDVDDEWEETLKVIKTSGAKYKKYLYLDAVCDLQYRTESLIDYYKKWDVKSDISKLQTIINDCIALRLAFKNNSEEDYYSKTVEIYKKHYPEYKKGYEELYKEFEQRAPVEITEGYKNNLKNVRMCWIRPEHKNYKKEEIDRIIFKHGIAYGFNFIKIDQMRQIMSNNFIPGVPNLWNWPVNYKNAKMFTNAIHRLGMLANIHLTTAFVHKEFLKKHPDWKMINARTGEAYEDEYYKGPGVVCINNPNFRDQYRKNLRKLFAECGFDSLNIDEIQFFDNNFCGCKYCRKKFKEKYGLEIPPPDDKAFWEDKDERYQKWVEFKIESINNDFFQDVVFKAVKNIYMSMYTSMPPATYGSQHSNASYEKQASYSRMNGNELHGMFSKIPWIFYYNWKDYWVQLQYVQAVARKYGNLSWALTMTSLMPCKEFKRRPYTDNFPAKGHPMGEDFFMWALLKAINTNVWLNSNYRIPVQFERKHENIFSATPRETFIRGTVGIYYSETMKMLYKQEESFWHKIYYWEMRAWGELCTQENIPFDILLEGSLKYDNLEKYSLIILPNSGFLSEQEVDTIKKYIQNGGNVVATYETSHYNSKGKKLDNFQLSGLIGFASAKEYISKYKGKIKYNNISISNLLFDHKTDFRPTDFEGYILKLDEKAIVSNKIEILASLSKANNLKKVMPAIIYRKFGKGNFYYMPAKLALETIRTPEISTKDAYIPPDKSIKKIFTQIIKKYGKNKLPWSIHNFPDGVFVNVLNNPKGGYTCHIVNAVNTNILKEGQKFTGGYIKYNKIPSEQKASIVINNPKGKITEAYLISPDFPENQEIAFTQENKKLEVSIPCDKLFRYMIVVLEE